MKNNIVILVGCTASGKTTIQREMSKNGFHKVITATTREPRLKDGEIDGIDYFFLKEDDMIKKINNNEFVEYEKFGNNIYGTPWSSLISKNTIPCVIVEPKGAKNLKNILLEKEWNVLVAWVDCPIDIAKERVKNRDKENNVLLDKRIKLMDTIEKDWPNYMEYDLKLNGLNDPKISLKEIKKKLNLKKNHKKKSNI